MNAEKVVWKVLAYMVKDSGRVFERISKTKFMKAYHELVRKGKIPYLKEETITRTLRRLARQGSEPYGTLPIKYLDRKKGVYLVEVPSVLEKAGEADD